MAVEASRRFMSKLNSLIDKTVVVRLVGGGYYKGRLTGLDPNTLSVVLEDAESSEGSKIPLVFIYGNGIREIVAEEVAGFNAREFAEFLVREGGFSWHTIKVYEDINVVEVAKAVRVTKDGVEGAGPLAQKVYTLFREYMRSKGITV